MHLLSRLGLPVAADHLGAVLVLQVALVPLLRLEEHLAVRAPEQRRVVNLWQKRVSFFGSFMQQLQCMSHLVFVAVPVSPRGEHLSAQLAHARPVGIVDDVLQHGRVDAAGARARRLAAVRRVACWRSGGRRGRRRPRRTHGCRRKRRSPARRVSKQRIDHQPRRGHHLRRQRLQFRPPAGSRNDEHGDRLVRLRL